MLGTAGASFAVALPLASRWYPPERQGLAMGIAAAGNSGTAIANLVAPMLADVVGWHNVLGLAMLPLALVLVAFTILAKDSPERSTGLPFSHYLKALKHRDMWWFCLLYSVTFGGYVGLSSFLPLFLRDQYEVTPAIGRLDHRAGRVHRQRRRPVGGYLADRWGGVRLLSFLLAGIGMAYALAATLPTMDLVTLLLVAGMACLGLGNGAVFQLVPRRFSAEIGIATGVVGAVGGLGGFMLPILLGNMKQTTGSFGPGFIVLAVAAFGGFVLVRSLVTTRADWRVSWRLPRPADDSSRRRGRMSEQRSLIRSLGLPMAAEKSRLDGQDRLPVLRRRLRPGGGRRRRARQKVRGDDSHPGPRASCAARPCTCRRPSPRWTGCCVRICGWIGPGRSSRPPGARRWAGRPNASAASWRSTARTASRSTSPGSC